jgi:hypothetical protein
LSARLREFFRQKKPNMALVSAAHLRIVPPPVAPSGAFVLPKATFSLPVSLRIFVKILLPGDRLGSIGQEDDQRLRDRS